MLKRSGSSWILVVAVLFLLYLVFFTGLFLSNKEGFKKWRYQKHGSNKGGWSYE
jgi:UPF0716 family protein affecting phage T7 exclusion